ncbi:MAG: aminoglycoside phosphotransferase family protein [Chloroflexota bacterium]|nr:aminoglycoside phosphotransferase family protein [Chloroflexota bacterium]
MPDTLTSIQDWAATLPGLESSQPEVTFKYERDGVRSYTLAAGDNRMRFKHYLDKPGTRPSLVERSARDSAQAEATALELYADEGLAPGLVWSGEMPAELGGYGVVYRRAEGLTAEAAYLTEAHAERLARALRQVHGRPLQSKLVAPQPRNLAGWWNRVHEQYRDLPPEFTASLPPALEESLVGLVQSVSGDANAHIRFWQGASLVPVHGNLTMRNVIFEDRRVTLVDWSRFGLGDPAYELASAVWEMALSGNEALVEHLAGPYLRQAGDIMLERRVLIYRRLLPFGRFLDFLHRHWRGESPTSHRADVSSRYLSAAMSVYGWQQQTIDQTVSQFDIWLTSQQQSQLSS